MWPISFVTSPSARLLDKPDSPQRPPTGKLEYHAEVTDDFQQVLSYSRSTTYSKASSPRSAI